MSTAPHAPRVLVTRPAGQAARFGAALDALGAEPVYLPCLEIEPVNTGLDPATDLPSGALAVFTSPNAVRHAPGLPWKDRGALGIGPATGHALEAAGQHVIAPAEPPYDSEALLAQLRDLPDAEREHGIVLVTGEGGRELLPRGLRAMTPPGCPFRRVEVYRRVDARPDPTTLAAAFEPLPELVCTTSDRSLDRLLALARQLDRLPAGTHRRQPSGQDHTTVLLTRSLVVNGARAQAHARALGFAGPLYAAQRAGDEGQLEQVRAWLDRRAAGL